MRILLTAVLLGLVAMAPAAHASESGISPGIVDVWTPTPTTLYFHVIDALQEFAINTQAPAAGFFLDKGIGLVTASHTCPSTPVDGTLAGGNYHHSFGYSSPGLVEYNVPEGGLPRTHPERGLAFDAALDPGTPVTLHWYLSTSTNTADVGAVESTLVIPDVAVHAWVRAGEPISIDNEGYKSGQLLAEGETVGSLGGLVPGATAATSPTGSITHSTVTDAAGATHSVYDYALAMDLKADTLPARAGFNVQIAVFLKSDACPDPANKILTPNFFHVHSSDGHRPRLELGVMNPLRIEYVHPQIVKSEDEAVWVLHTSINSPWGSYDIDTSSTPGSNGTRGGVSLEVIGPDGPVHGLYRAVVVQRFHEHGHDYGTQPADIAFVWPYKAVGARDGAYEVRFTATNLQHTAAAVASTRFTLGDPNELVICDHTPSNREEVQASSHAARAESHCRTQLQDAEGNILDPVRRAPGWGLLGAVSILGAFAWAARRRA